MTDVIPSRFKVIYSVVPNNIMLTQPYPLFAYYIYCLAGHPRNHMPIFTLQYCVCPRLPPLPPSVWAL